MQVERHCVVQQGAAPPGARNVLPRPPTSGGMPRIPRTSAREGESQGRPIPDCLIDRSIRCLAADNVAITPVLRTTRPKVPRADERARGLNYLDCEPPGLNGRGEGGGEIRRPPAISILRSRRQISILRKLRALRIASRRVALSFWGPAVGKKKRGGSIEPDVGIDETLLLSFDNTQYITCLINISE